MRLSAARGSAAMQRRILAAIELVAVRRRSVANSSRKPFAARLGRGPRRIARSSVAIARVHPPAAAEPAQRMLEQRQQRHRLQAVAAPPRRRAARKCRPACPSAHRRRNRRPAHSSGQRRQHAARQRAVGRHQRRGLARVSRASRSATAMASASSSALAASITARFCHAAGDLLPRHPARSSRSCHSVGRGGRAATLPTPASRARAPRARQASTSSRAMPMRLSSAVHGELRMAGGGRRVNAPSPCPPPIMFHASSSRSVSRPGSTTAPCGSVAMAASSFAVAGIEPVEPAAITGPHAAREPRGFRLDQAIAPRRRLDPAALLQDCRPIARARFSGNRA